MTKALSGDTEVVLCKACGRTKGRKAMDGSLMVNPINSYMIDGQVQCCFGAFVADLNQEKPS